MRTDMEVNRYAPKLAVAVDMGWIPGTMRRKIQTQILESFKLPCILV